MGVRGGHSEKDRGPKEAFTLRTAEDSGYHEAEICKE